jgi:hypothetical protein
VDYQRHVIGVYGDLLDRLAGSDLVTHRLLAKILAGKLARNDELDAVVAHAARSSRCRRLPPSAGGTVRSPSLVREEEILSVRPEGGCACGAVRYRLTSDPLFVHCCHCLNCQRQTGSAFVINVLIEADRVELLAGEPQPVSVPRSGGKKQKIWRCPTCQVAVFSQYTRRQLRFVRAGTLDDPAAVAPDVHIFTRSKLPWVTLPDSVPAFNVYYDTKKLWPAASLERLEALAASR